MPFRLVVATNNRHKFDEYRSIFKGTGIELLMLRDMGVTDEPVESGSTYRDNALIKARSARLRISLPVFADDSGLEVTALGGFPGVRSARYAEKRKSQEEANESVIGMLKGKRDRTAHFRCAIVLLGVGDVPLTFEGDCPGRILRKPEGDRGFGYDPIFYSDEADMPFGRAEPEVKNKFSHRAKAARKMLAFLKEKGLSG